MEQNELFASIRARSPSPRWGRILGLLVVLALVSIASAALWAINRPPVIEAAIRWAIANPDLTLDFDDLSLDPATGRMTVAGLRLAHVDPMRPTVRLSWASFAFPLPDETWAGLEIADADVIGLDIHSHRQRPPPAWEATEPLLRSVTIRSARVRGAHFRADRDAPLEAAAVTGIAGQLADVRYSFGDRALSGTADLEAHLFRSGALVLTTLRLSVVAEDSNLEWKDGTFRVAGGRGRVRGKVTELFRKPTVDLEGDVDGLALDRLVRMATGQPSPIEGVVAGDIRVRTGGNLRRGDARIDGTVEVTDAHLPLALAPEGLVRAALRLTTLVYIDRHDQIRLRDLSGGLSFFRGKVTIDELVYASRRAVRVDGVIDETAGVALLVRQARLRPLKTNSIGAKLGELVGAIVPEVVIGEARKAPRLVWGKRRAGKGGAEEGGAVDQEVAAADVPYEVPASDRAAFGFMVTGKPGQVRLRLATPAELEW